MLDTDKNIALIGFMGVGKTTFGKMLAKSLDKKFIDTDDKIKAAENLDVTDIFKKYGEAYFRKLEKKVCLEISLLKNCVVATGGGIVKNKNNIINLKKSSILVHLDATPEKIYQNIKDDTTRPLLNNCENKILKITSLLSERIDKYKSYCDISINVNESSIEKNFEKILNQLNKKLT